eukprot:TRINITY_DN30472_c0_g1_i1.p1 TRINITY_DN30472_c0_g1~~TRINITY_DN30472_c0_g1_i1.p1  ORF type:complete len:427 (-),score=41.62 TRINITY_DN30472_c0_g1_i1:67-1347(-)
MLGSWRELVPCIFVLTFVACADDPRPCPEPRATKSSKLGTPMQMVVRNVVNVEVDVMWLGSDGQETFVQSLAPGEDGPQETYTGHVFRIYGKSADETRTLLSEHVAKLQGERTLVTACGDKFQNAVKGERGAEFTELSQPFDAPCEPAEDSSKWSCSRVLDKDDLGQRDPSLYGLPEGQAEDGKKSFDMVDKSYVHQIKDIPRVTASGPGFMRMKFTPRMLEAVQWWNEYSSVHGAGSREYVPGGYTNARSIEQDILSLDHHRKIHALLTREMQQVLEWWTGLSLEHTATYGVRTYHRSSVLIDHVDREDTHIASAVLQMSQSVDENGGWPLEVMMTNGRIGEVYLQPGEMVLYEGAWLRHGRPMRLRGDNFSNVFCHFRPKDWSETNHLKGHRYYGVPEDRLTTLADDGVTSSLDYGFLAKRHDL